MDNTFKLMKPVQWHEGLLLYPQHFQQMRHEFRELALCYLSVSTPYYWGVRSMEIDEGAFPTGLLRITSLLAVMPDGSVVEHDEKSTQTIELHLKDYQELLDKGPLTIHLAVIRHHFQSAMVGGDFPRYDSVESPPLIDENTGEDALPIPRLALKAFLIAGDQVPARYSSFPLLKIKPLEGHFILDDFIPPTTDIRAGSQIGELARKVVANIRKQSAVLAEKLQTPMAHDMAPVLDQYRKNYDVLVAQLLGLEALVHAQVVHPFLLYKELCDLAGAFCTFGRGYLPPILAPYDHNDLKKTFEPIKSLIGQMLDFLKSASAVFGFRLEDRVFRSIVKQEWIQGDFFILGVTIPAGGHAQTTTEWLKDAVIASASLARKAVERRVVGAAREMVEQVTELGLTITRGKLLLRVKAHSEYIRIGEELCIFNGSDVQGMPAEIVLYAASE